MRRRYAGRDRGGGARRPMRDGVDDEGEARWWYVGQDLLSQRGSTEEARCGGMPGDTDEATVKLMLSRGDGGQIDAITRGWCDQWPRGWPN